MLVYLDDDAVTVPGDSVAAALEAVGAAAHTRGRIVIEVLCDGRPATADVLAGRSTAPCSELRCRSADPAQIVADTLADAAAELAGLVPDQKSACEKLWVGRTTEAMDDLRTILQRWQLVKEALEQCLGASGQNLATLRISSGMTGADLSSLLARSLGQVRSELAAGRMVELADLLGTDLAVLAVQWRDLVLDLRRAVLGQANGPGAVP